MQRITVLSSPILNLHIGIEIDDVPIWIAKPNGSASPRLGRRRFNNLNIHSLQTLKFLVNVFYLKLDSIATISSSLQGLQEPYPTCVLRRRLTRQHPPLE